MNHSSPAQGARSESGFTLIELMVYISLSVVVLIIVGGLLISSTRAERDVRAATEATSLGQLISRSVQAGVRNASHVRLLEIDDTQLLLVRTAGGGTPLVWSCQAWFYSPVGGGTLYAKKTTPAAQIVPPTPSGLASWAKLGEGLSATGAKVFSGLTGRITLTLDLDAGDRAPVSISSAATIRTLATRSDPCF